MRSFPVCGVRVLNPTQYVEGRGAVQERRKGRGEEGREGLGQGTGGDWRGGGGGEKKRVVTERTYYHAWPWCVDHGPSQAHKYETENVGCSPSKQREAASAELVVHTIISAISLIPSNFSSGRTGVRARFQHWAGKKCTPFLQPRRTPSRGLRTLRQRLPPLARRAL